MTEYLFARKTDLDTLAGSEALRYDTAQTLTSGQKAQALSNLGTSSVTPAALTKTDDTNVTLTLGGTPSTALLQAASVTVGWNGTLAAGRLNANVVQSTVNDTNVTGAIAAQALTLGWTGTLAAGRLNGNVVQAVTNDTNVTGSIAAQTVTLGWSGTLAAGRLNANVVQAITNDTNINGSITAQNLTLAWAGTLANARLANMAAFTLKGNNTSGSAAPTDITIDGLTAKGSPANADEVMIWDVAGNAWKKATLSSLPSSAGVTSIAGNTGAFTLGTGLTNSVNVLQNSGVTSNVAGQGISVSGATGAVTISINHTSVTNTLGADVALNNTATFFDGPSCAQGTSGTWYASGTVTVLDSGAAANFRVKLWDGTTVIASTQVSTAGASSSLAVTLSGVLVSPAANIKMTVKDISFTTGAIKFNVSGESKDSSLTVVRIA